MAVTDISSISFGDNQFNLKDPSKYEKPAGGIPYSDLENSVKASLDKADSALQQHQSLAAYRTSSAQDAIDATKLSSASKGVPGGVAELDTNGKIPVAQCPIEEDVAQATTDWLDEHIAQETGYVIDNSLTVTGAAADAKKVGDEVDDLKSAIDGYEDIVGGVFRYEKDSKGWLTAKYNLKAGSTYTMKNTGSQNISPIRSMIGETVIDVFESVNLDPGKTLLITPTADAECLSMYFKGSTGTHAFEIYKNDSYIGEAINTAKTITVSPSGADYASLAEAIEFCGANGISTIHVLKGTYDILAEYQALHPEDWDTLNSGRGIVVSHGMTLIFDPQAFVTCHYAGDSEYIQQNYSAFDVRFGGATFIGLNISCSRIKYCVHDDQWTWAQPTVSKFIGCKMELDNRESVTNPTLQCIGGGFGVQSSVEIRDCCFIGHEVGEQEYDSPLWVSYHSSPSENSQSKILITGCYFDGNGTVGLLTAGTTQLKTLAVVANNRLGSQLYLAQGYEDQFEVVAFNNAD